MRATAIFLALATSGCSIVLAPNPDAIVPSSMDAALPDAGHDAGVDGAIDDGDAGFDGGDANVCNEDVEVTCNDGIDNDCDGNADCLDPNCASDGYCCDPSRGTSSWPGDLVRYGEWVAFSAPTVMPTRVEFGTSIGQLVHPDCAPLAYGMRFELTFTRAGMRATDFAAFVLAPVDTPRGGGDMTLLADLALRVTGDGRAQLERAGTVIGSSPVGAELPLGDSLAQIDLTPSVDSAGRPVLLVSASVGTFPLVATSQVLMPLDDLIGPDGGCRPDGLHVALEGFGSSVQIGSAVITGIGDCDNPTQFLSDAMGPLAEADVLPSGTSPGEWRAGGAGEPTLLAVHEGSTTTRLELLVDGSETERSDDFLRLLDYSIGGSTRVTLWTHRARGPGGPAELLGDLASSREPAFASGAPLDPYIIAFARRRGTTDVHEIAWVTLDPNTSATPTAARVLLAPGTNEGGAVVGCDSLRDPSVVALLAGGSTPPPPDLLLFFTCERESMPDTIGVTRLRRDSGSMNGFLAGEVILALLGPTAEDYGRRGVFSPEVVVHGDPGDTRSLRIWYLARDGGGRVRVALAYGEVDDALPRVTSYPGNPILDAEAQLLGGTCPGGCAIESFGVTATEGASSLWPPFFGREPSYIFLIERSRFRPDGVDHELIPLRQPRPSGG